MTDENEKPTEPEPEKKEQTGAYEAEIERRSTEIAEKSSEV